MSEIPLRVRQAVHARDNGICRLCGSFATAPHLHHITYRSQGGLHVLENLVTLHFRCHDEVHRDKRLWAPLLTSVAMTSMNARQVLRWARTQEIVRRVPSASFEGER